jgi:hypothetical protein
VSRTSKANKAPEILPQEFFMKPTTILAIATVFLLLPFSVRAQATGVNSPTNGQHMVPAQGTLVENVDAQKNRAGEEVDVKLTQTARLADGTKLPAGTLLVGDIAQDDLQIDGRSKIALRFTQAKLKDGTSLPLKATIVGVSDSDGYPVAAWSKETTQIDQIGALSHVDLHSRIASNNSGVFVSTDRDDVKLKAGSEIGFAIAVVKADASVSQPNGNQ